LPHTAVLTASLSAAWNMPGGVGPGGACKRLQSPRVPIVCSISSLRELDSSSFVSVNAAWL